MFKKTTSYNQNAILVALEMQSRSVCSRRRVGAVIVKDGNIVVQAMNGPLPSIDLKKWPYCLRNEQKIPSAQRHEICRGLHAEEYAIAEAARQGIQTLGAEIYVTTKPCSVCIRMIIQAGISRVFYLDNFSDSFTDQIVETAKIELVQVITEAQ